MPEKKKAAAHKARPVVSGEKVLAALADRLDRLADRVEALAAEVKLLREIRVTVLPQSPLDPPPPVVPSTWPPWNPPHAPPPVWTGLKTTSGGGVS